MSSLACQTDATPPEAALHRVARVALVLLGVVLSFLFFVWVERNMALPWLGPWLAVHGGKFGAWPIVFVDANWGPIWLVPTAWNLGLIAIFGFAHSALAGDRVSRPVYVAATGIVVLGVMAFWQSTGVVLWQAIPSAALSSLLSIALFWGLHAVAAVMIADLEPLPRFLGLKPAPKNEPVIQGLRTDGVYSRVRHPGYSLTILAWFLAPMMSLDRLTFAVGMTLYLAIGIRLEERRLIARFGDAYGEYRKRVPALVPRF